MLDICGGTSGYCRGWASSPGSDTQTAAHQCASSY